MTNKTKGANSSNFSLNLYRELDKQNVSCKELASEIGLSLRIIYAYQAGERFPTIKNLIKITNYLGVTMDNILQ